MRRGAVRDDDEFDTTRSHYRDEDDERRSPARRERPRSSPGLFVRMYRLVRFLVFILPLSVLLIGSFLVDCRNRSGSSFMPDVFRISACTREDLTGRLSTLEDTMRTLSRAIR
ncbi:MAG: hypothetical protein K2Y56_02690 [Methylobacterium sp.]|uniref:hypothetical protein n=1 Tax=Methylobacterium sp. TaxID=409 RepID=UPI0025D3DDA6|nr:hypothetical protein [Methylobacterium sp.]MBX9930439.1 hypothetical protein [Methylobacterium sp.]